MRNHTSSPLIRPSATSSPRTQGEGVSLVPPRPAQRGEGGAQRRVRGAACAALLFIAASMFAQTPSTPAPQQPEAVVTGHYVGVASCANSGCHGATQPLKSTHVRQN